MPFFTNPGLQETLNIHWQSRFVWELAPKIAGNLARRGPIGLPMADAMHVARNKSDHDAMQDLWGHTFFDYVKSEIDDWRITLQKTLGLDRPKTDPADILVYYALVAAAYDHLTTDRVIADRAPKPWNVMRHAARTLFIRGQTRRSVDLAVDFYKSKVPRSANCFEPAYRQRYRADVVGDMWMPVKRADFEGFTPVLWQAARNAVSDIVGEETGKNVLSYVEKYLVVHIGQNLRDDLDIANRKAAEAIIFIAPEKADEILTETTVVTLNALERRGPGRGALIDKLIGIREACSHEWLALYAPGMKGVQLVIRRIVDQYKEEMADKNADEVRRTTTGVKLRVYDSKGPKQT